MPLPPPETPLYNHPLPEIEQWLIEHGCKQDKTELHCWQIQRPDWDAELCLDIDQLTVRYFQPGEGASSTEPFSQPAVQRSFKYSLSRQDIEAAVFAGP
ncbi:DUF3143 domain-containing protein [Kovacikia minuta CCNUW1]|uniref:DUF3143 domain-containing protein n=1 Tax=Kovacikia minuta TaxID=2931930 RepID=UPI001CCAAC14|nr:DUF3143 domain-containing protein [Kovacikia minuta]UBF26798.1 DUF3143 domain-containing protein [Kovacikia minuta CCNUW1]